jgi:predicted regulator of Ras-like GTPase activity (Roadblock/LC7/MglB family)
MAGTFIKHIERARAAATVRARPAEKAVEELSGDELHQALVDARREAVAANRAVAEAAAEHTRPPTLAAKLAELQRGKRKHWR